MLHVCSDTNIGGAGRYVITLLRQRLIQERFEVAVACPEGALARLLRHEGIPVLLYPGAEVSFSVAAVRVLMKRMRAWKPHIVHTHGALAGRIAGRLSGTRVIITKHGLASADEQAIQLRSPGALLKWASVRVLADRIVAVSEAVSRSLVRAGANPNRIRVVPGGTETENYSQVGPLVPGVIGAFGRLSREKGFDQLLEAMAILKGEPVQLLLGGDGPQRNALLEQAKSLGLTPDQFSAVGFVSDVPEFMARTGIFVLPSRSEGMGLVLVEAMSAGRPVVASRCGGVPEVVVDGETGLLVSPESPVELAAAIRRLVASPEEAYRMGVAGRDRARSHFGAGRMAEQMTALYEELL